MRSDNSLKQEYVDSEFWEQDALTGKSGGEVDRYKLPDSRKARLSLSGSETNSFFVKSPAGKYLDVSGLSGLDSESDSRCIAFMDFDRDGFQDFLVTNTNNATLNVFRNQKSTVANDAGNFIAVRVVGGNVSRRPSQQFSSRDAVGTRIETTCGALTSVAEFRCGEGLATQNSRTKIIGLGTSTHADFVKVSFPSGISRVITKPESGQLVTVYEDAGMSSAENGIEVTPYGPARWQPAMTTSSARKKLPNGFGLSPSQAPLRVVLAMATWCEKCRSKIDEIKWLQEQFGDQVQFIAIPVDLKDSQQKLDDYVAKFKPTYRLLKKDLMRSLAALELAKSELGDGALPHSFIISADNSVLKVQRGLPTVSELRRLARDHRIELKP